MCFGVYKNLYNTKRSHSYMENMFITGATGLVGSTILEALVTQSELKIFYLLVRDKEKAKSKLNNILNKANNLGKEVCLFEGNITKENFGLSQEEITLLKEVEEVYHLAAIISLSKNNKDNIFKTNFDGTRNLLNIFKETKKLKNLFYFSTAYVCGRQNETIKEEWLSKPIEFRNPYEESKWLAEDLIQQYLKDYKIPITVLRPSIIGSEDKSKFDELKNQTIYLHGAIIRKATLLQEEDKDIRLVGKPNTFINLITLEDIIKILLKIRSLQNKQIIYNLTNSKNCLAISFLEGLQKTINFRSKYIFTENLEENKLSETEKYIYQRTKHFFTYNLDSGLNWDSTNTDKLREELKLNQKDEIWLNNHAKNFFLTIKDE